MRCRKFKKADSKQVSELMIKAFKSFLGDKLENLNEFSPSVFEKISNFKDVFSERISFVVADNKKIVGYISVTAGKNGLGSLEIVGVEPEYFSRGVGKILMKKAEEFWASKKQRKISTCVSAHNKRALIYYIKNGFIPEGYRRDHFFVGVDEIILWRFL